jgi:ppGpp synthetase/RelA/SpoT-type nucleotidyltranferase
MEKATTSDLSNQIKNYEKLYEIYQAYALTLEDFFKNACQEAVPQAIIQTRAKSLSSFAEKAIRKAKEYPDPINQFGDLCGARIIVHTNEQVKWVNEFVEKNFEVVEKEDVQRRLGENQFGYLSIHYIVKLMPEHDYVIPKQTHRELIGKKAEVQVKTILQHAWSDILHDRTYKRSIKLPEDIKRNSAILAALLEESDDKFGQVVERTDNYFLNYSAYMTREEIIKEIETLQEILQLEPNKENKPSTALKLARLTSLISSDPNTVINQLEPYLGVQGKERPYIMLELGYAICRAHRNNPKSKEYKKGQELFETVLETCSEMKCSGVIDKSQIAALIAQVYAKLAWSYEPLKGRINKTSDLYYKALKSEPCNPYFLSESLAYKCALRKMNAVPEELHIQIKAAIATCTSHALAGMELPQAHFSRGRLCLLMGEYETAYGYYALGIHHFLDKEHFTPNDALEREEEWLNLLACPDDDENIDHVRTLLMLGKTVSGDEEAKKELFKNSQKTKMPEIRGDVMIVAGGASYMNNADYKTARELIRIALHGFEGTIISGGTTAGIPGIVGEVVNELLNAGKRITLLGYIPTHLPSDAPKSPYYKTIKCSGGNFSAEQLHQSWIDILKAGIDPASVKLIGINGGKISMMEYKLAAALGAKTSIILKTGRAADELADDTEWKKTPNMMFIPNDPASISQFLFQEKYPFDPKKKEELAQHAHQAYFDKRIKENPDDALRYWVDLKENLRNSNRLQVECSVINLRKAGFDVQPVEKPDPQKETFSDEEIEILAELEHGRWNAERLLEGWKYGPVKDGTQKINPSLIAWEDLSNKIKEYDREAVKAFSEILAKAGLEIFRMKNQKKIFDKTKEMLAMKYEFSKEKPKK